MIPASPVQVTYRVTALGETLYPLLHMMCAWGYAHMGDQIELQHPTCTAQGKKGDGQVTKAKPGEKFVPSCVQPGTGL